jgi:hypothetical protein
MHRRNGTYFSKNLSSSLSSQDSGIVFDSDEYQPSDMDTDPTNNSDAGFDSDLEDAFPPSVFDTNEHQPSDMETDLTSQSDAESESESDIGNLSPDYFLQIEVESDDDADQTAFSAATLKQLDGIERRWKAYVRVWILLLGGLCD